MDLTDWLDANNRPLSLFAVTWSFYPPSHKEIRVKLIPALLGRVRSRRNSDKLGIWQSQWQHQRNSGAVFCSRFCRVCPITEQENLRSSKAEQDYGHRSAQCSLYRRQLLPRHVHSHNWKIELHGHKSNAPNQHLLDFVDVHDCEEFFKLLYKNCILRLFKLLESFEDSNRHVQRSRPVWTGLPHAEQGTKIEPDSNMQG